MVQAARSGKQNFAEASMASATSKETEIKLTNVASTSLDELLRNPDATCDTTTRPPWTTTSKFT